MCLSDTIFLRQKHRQVEIGCQYFLQFQYYWRVCKVEKPADDLVRYLHSLHAQAAYATCYC